MSDLYDGTTHWSTTAGLTATFTFTGAGATIYGVKDVDPGIATYSVDHDRRDRHEEHGKLERHRRAGLRDRLVAGGCHEPARR